MLIRVLITFLLIPAVASAATTPASISILRCGRILSDLDLSWIESVANRINHHGSAIVNDEALSGIYIFTDFPEKDVAERWKKSLREKFLTLSGSKESLTPQKDFLPIPEPLNEFSTVVSHDEDAITLKISTNPNHISEGSKLFHDALLRVNMQQFQRAYRSSGLVSNDLNGGMALLGEWLETMGKGGELPDAIYLKFDKVVWNSIVYRINRFVAERETQGKTISNINPKYLDENIFEPLFPSYGLSVFVKSNGEAGISKVEFKRLFRNDEIDPLELLPNKKGTSKDSLQFYLDVVSQLPKNTVVVAEAHRNGLIAFYQHLKFQETGKKTVAIEGKERTATIFEQTRENLIQRFKELLNLN